MPTDDPRPPAYVCAPMEPVEGFFQRLSSPDWRSSFDVLELDRDQLALLDSTGLWDEISARCGVNIDIYEEARVPADQIGFLLECVVRARASEGASQEADALLGRLSALAEAASRRKAPVLFLF